MSFRVRDRVTRVNDRSYAVGSKPGVCLDERPDSPAAAWYMMFFFTKILHKVQNFREKDGIFRPAGGEISFRVRDRVSPV